MTAVSPQAIQKNTMLEVARVDIGADQKTSLVVGVSKLGSLRAHVIKDFGTYLRVSVLDPENLIEKLQFSKSLGEPRLVLNHIQSGASSMLLSRFDQDLNGRTLELDLYPRLPESAHPVPESQVNQILEQLTSKAFSGSRLQTPRISASEKQIPSIMLNDPRNTSYLDKQSFVITYVPEVARHILVVYPAAHMACSLTVQRARSTMLDMNTESTITKIDGFCRFTRSRTDEKTSVEFSVRQLMGSAKSDWATIFEELVPEFAKFDFDRLTVKCDKNADINAEHDLQQLRLPRLL